MATQEDVRRLALALPETEESPDKFAFSVMDKGKRRGIAWVWLERLEPKGPRMPQPEVLAVRVANEEQKHLLIGAMPDVFFTEPHYNGFPAVLVRLAAIEPDMLESLLIDAWRLRAPKAMQKEFDAARAAASRD